MDNSGSASISINGEVISLRFGIPAVRMFLEHIASDTVSVSNESINEVGVAYLIYCGYVNDCMIRDVVPAKNKGFFLEYVENAWVDDSVRSELEAISKAYADSKFTKRVLSNIQANMDEVKKKIAQ